jgi:hypothetical protein
MRRVNFIDSSKIMLPNRVGTEGNFADISNTKVTKLFRAETATFLNAPTRKLLRTSGCYELEEWALNCANKTFQFLRESGRNIHTETF